MTLCMFLDLLLWQGVPMQPATIEPTIKYVHQFVFYEQYCYQEMMCYYIQNVRNPLLLFTSLAKEVMFLVALVSLSVCMSVCLFVCLWTTLLKKL